ncbi:MAG: hypothetical protein RQ826_08225 [Xanthomonadales bacterium]|nr:hypothetical protein [Xanthomonadales bacterium]
MEYGLRIATLEGACRSPAEICDAALWKLFPEAPLTALYFGSEFCQELLPGTRDAEAFCAYCKERGLEAVLLTPLVTQRGLGRLSRLFGGLVGRGWCPTIAFNDWGVFELLRNAYPALPMRMGRLMNRGLRDPRLDMKTERAEGENTERGAGIRKLASSLGVRAVESDADLEPGYLGTGSNGLQRTLHVPYTFVSSGRNCLEKAAAAPAGKGLFTGGLTSGCKAPCRGVCRQEHRRDTQKPLWRAGNTLFFEAPPQWISRHMALADRVVFHERPLP